MVASRLSENEKFNVLLLEAGGDDSVISNVPFMYWYWLLYNDNKFYWRYDIQPSPNTFQGVFWLFSCQFLFS